MTPPPAAPVRQCSAAAAAIDSNFIGTTLCSCGSHFVHITAAATATATTTSARRRQSRPPAVVDETLRLLVSPPAP